MLLDECRLCKSIIYKNRKAANRFGLNHAVHRNVVCVGGYGFLLLEVEAYADFVSACGFRQEAVVIAFAAAETVALGVERHAGDDGDVDSGVVGEQVQLLKGVGGGALAGNAHQPHRALGPHLADQLPGGLVDDLGGIGGVGQTDLVAGAAEGVVHQLHRYQAF